MCDGRNIICITCISFITMYYNAFRSVNNLFDKKSCTETKIYRDFSIKIYFPLSTLINEIIF